MPTLKDVADLAGVTVTTVSRMLNNKANVSEKTQKKIREAMKELNYLPNEVARSLINKKSNMIGLIVPSAINFFFANLIQYVETYVSSHNYKLLLCISDLDKDKERECFAMLNANRVDGVIVASRTQNIEKSINFKAPIVTIERALSDDVPSVSPDNYNGGELAALSLMKAGCQNLLYIGSSHEDIEACMRLTGFSDTLRKNGVKNAEIIHAGERDYVNLSYGKVIEELFRKHPRTDGIFAANDVIASQILQYCHNKKIAIPKKLQIIGYDDAGLAALTTPLLSSIRQPIKEMCRAAVENIIQQSNNQTVPKRTVFPVSLIIRESGGLKL